MRISFSCVRRSVQVVFALFCLFTGWRFYRYYLWLTGASAAAAVRPPSVEVFPPISALLGFKSFLVTGVFDSIHPAGLVILLAAVGSVLLLRRAFYGYICPIGLFPTVFSGWANVFCLVRPSRGCWSIQVSPDMVRMFLERGCPLSLENSCSIYG